jgi:formate dehydrogenase major subunit
VRRPAPTRGWPTAAEHVRRDQSKVANDRGIRNNDYVWVKTPTGFQLKVMAQVTERVGPDTVSCRFTFRLVDGRDMLDYYPDGAAPIVRGEAVNTATTYGYDSRP